MTGQLPIERLTPGRVFDKIGIDFAGPVQVWYDYVRKPVIIMYICLFVSLSVKAVNMKPVSDLTTDAFIAALRRFTAWCGKPSLILSDHGTNFTSATRELKEVYDYFNKQKTKKGTSLSSVLLNVSNGDSIPNMLHTLEACGKQQLQWNSTWSELLLTQN